MKLITLKEEYDLILKETVTEYMNPNFIYLPINERIKSDIKMNDYIYKGQKIGEYLYSPISGNALDIIKLEDNKEYIIIENDFKEKFEVKNSVRKNLNKLQKEDLLNLIKEYNESLYDKFNKNYQKIIINGIEEQPYVGNNIFILKKYNKNILDLVDDLSEILKTKNNLILLKDTDYLNINCLNTILGMYPNINIKFLPDKYLISKKEILLDQLNLEDNFLYLNIEEMYNLYNFLIRRKINEDKYITFTGNAIKNPQVIKCKIGTPLINIIDEFIKFNNEDYIIIINSLINGVEITGKEIVINENIRAIFFMEKTFNTENKCINCGKCSEVCPVKINVYNLVNNKNCDKSKCINCGLCTYICPSYINIKKYLNGDIYE